MSRGQAVAARPPGPTGETHRVSLLRGMTAIRLFEERCVELYSAGMIRGFLHVAIGEEAVAVGVMQPLTDDDSIVSTYREHGHAIARGVPMESVMAEMYGKVTGCSRGRGGSMHLFDVGRRFYGGNAEGELHECVNLAALWQLPVLFACENNLYAMGTALHRAQAETDLAL